MRTLLLLILEFFKTGLFAVGGGLSTIPFLTDMEQRFPHWFSETGVADIIAVAESTPGPIGVNAATFAGYSAAGVPGALTATLSLILPSIIVITIISKFLDRYRSSKLVNDTFAALRPAVTGLIAASGLSVLILAVATTGGTGLAAIDWRCALIFAGLLALLHWKPTKGIHPIAYIGVGAVLGLLLGL